ncbi:L-aspartate/glutamate-specific racemase (plasmid) [Pantoea sp. Nvir]|uniref:aspartate/glutamate racemase family protein n=1 Tax=unclassified Pantoea TaxID=2630326 RepID=UPI001EF647DD|nr:MULTISPECIES: aspartate/glutamate racemase family protein [unclassified Pantoea]MCG7368066.1 aspartate/glutamate racemase family protein [Pantoea sp. ACRSH]MCG7398425.1 aspartate/glutamate racemase family protein [Pantoea sp. ACRSC]
MKTIGLIGGMSWESTALYYRILNEEVKRALGGLHSARVVLYSLDFDEIEKLQSAGRWDEAGVLLAQAAQALSLAGADFLVLATNTMHKVAGQIEQAVAIPLLHIADATAQRIHEMGLNKVGLLATRFTMEEAFYRGRLTDKFGLEVITPEQRDRDFIHQVIYEELCQGIINPESRVRFCEIMARLAAQGAEGIILGCTEITMLVTVNDASVPLFDTTQIHAQRAVQQALQGE